MKWTAQETARQAQIKASGHKAKRVKTTEGPNTYWRYECECGHVTRNKHSIDGASAAYIGHLYEVEEGAK